MQQEQHKNYEHKKKTKNFATSRLTHHRPILLNIFSVFTYKFKSVFGRLSKSQHLLLFVKGKLFMNEYLLYFILENKCLSTKRNGSERNTISKSNLEIYSPRISGKTHKKLCGRAYQFH